MKAWMGFWVSSFLVLTTACSGEDEESPYEWQCYARDDLGSCECYEVKKGATADVAVSSAVVVDDCKGYEVCRSYYDTLKEQGRCDCGGTGFEPYTNENQRRDEDSESDCPVD